MAEPLIVVGAGGFGRETLDVVEAMNAASDEPVWNLLGVVDDAPSPVNLTRLRERAVPFIGPLDAIPRHAWVALAVGSPQARARLDVRLAGNCAGFAPLVHPTAVIGSRHSAGEGVIVCAHASIGTNVTLGRQVHLNPHAVIGHDARLGDCVSVNPNATVSGECVLESEVLVGAGAVVLQGLRVESHAVVGAAACVTRDVGRSDVLVGVPARPLNEGESS
jgi:sugar O-acyltransferase (sialic acid O-acetyltransferase NeuD family)